MFFLLERSARFIMDVVFETFAIKYSRVLILLRKSLFCITCLEMLVSFNTDACGENKLTL